MRDSEIIRFLNSLAEKPASFRRLHFSNSSDMGYKANFISVFAEDVSKAGRGNSARAALVDYITKLNQLEGGK